MNIKNTSILADTQNGTTTWGDVKRGLRLSPDIAIIGGIVILSYFLTSVVTKLF
jgi:hypothetical protein